MQRKYERRCYFLSQSVLYYDALKEWLYMHEEARYVASLTSSEPELVEFGRKFEESINEGLMKS